MPYGQEKSVSAADRRMKAVMASMASAEATSPASCPPMPSATQNRDTSRSATKASSFVLRTRPTSDTALAYSNRNPPDRRQNPRFERVKTGDKDFPGLYESQVSPTILLK